MIPSFNSESPTLKQGWGFFVLISEDRTTMMNPFTQQAGRNCHCISWSRPSPPLCLPLLLSAIWMLLLTGCQHAKPEQMPEPALARYEFKEMHMGTDVRMVLYATDSLIAADAADAAYQRIADLEEILSDYIDKSEINRLSRTSGSGRTVRVSEPLYRVLKRAGEISERTGGAFDLTVGPFVELWRISRRIGELVPEEEVREAARSVDYRNIRFDEDCRCVELRESGMKLDAGGIGKGFASDEALAVLKKHGITSALVASAGDIAVGEAPPGRAGWEVGLNIVNDEGERVEQTVTLTNAAISTSGDLFQFLLIDGVRYSHIVNPRTGYGITRQGFVTVIAPDATTADGYASAFSVLGPEKTDQLTEVLDTIDYYFILAMDDGYSVSRSDGFAHLLGE